MKNTHPFGRQERGATLLVALIFLVIMATLGTTLARNTGLEERMASNTRDRDLALQAAEAALADAEVAIRTDAGVRAGAPNVVLSNGNSAAYWESCFVNHNTSPCTSWYIPDEPLPTSGGGAIAEQPKYIVERMPDVGTQQIYRVTVRAVGGIRNDADSSDSVVVLQAEYSYSTT